MTTKLQKEYKHFFSFTKLEPSGCLEWQGHRDGKGYGRYRFRGRDYRAHRFAWLIKFGRIPDGYFACHRCDNPRCVNVDHLFIGPPSENSLDARQKGRLGKKITPALLRKVRELLGTCIVESGIANICGIPKQLVIDIKNGKRDWEILGGLASLTRGQEGYQRPDTDRSVAG